MGVAQRLGDLAQQVEARVDGQAVAALGEVVVQPLGARDVLEHECRPALVLGVDLALQDAGVADAVEDRDTRAGRPPTMAARASVLAPGSTT